MKIIKTYDNPYFKEKSRVLGNCFIVKDKENIYHYEFIINNTTATIISYNDIYITEVIDKFRFYNKYITKFKTKDNSFYKSFDDIFTFKLPISVIAPSQFFINEDKLNNLDNYMDIDEIYLPVNIINDEYILLDGHHRLYLAYINHKKMVNVYIDEFDDSIYDFIYFAKEQNIKNIKDLKVISKELYKELWDGFCDQYFNSK